MNRFLMAGASAALAASVSIGGLLLAGPAGASAKAAAAPQAAATCRASAHNYPFPGKPASYRAGAAGKVTVAPVNSGTIKVASVHASRGYRAFVDSAQGSSVDVYFLGHARSVKFEAEINDWGGLTVTVTTCGR